MSIFGGIFGVGGGGSGAATFLELTDTPVDYTNAADAVVRVKNAEDGLQFTTAASTGVIIDDNNRMTIDFSSPGQGQAGLTINSDVDGNHIRCIGTFPQIRFETNSGVANQKVYQLISSKDGADNSLFSITPQNDVGNGANMIRCVSTSNPVNPFLPVPIAIQLLDSNVVIGSTAGDFGNSNFEAHKSAAFTPVFLGGSGPSKDAVLHCITSNPPITITVQSAHIAALGRVFIFKDASGNASVQDPITIATEGAQTIDAAADAKITAPFGVIRLFSDAGNLFSF